MHASGLVSLFRPIPNECVTDKKLHARFIYQPSTRYLQYLFHGAVRREAISSSASSTFNIAASSLQPLLSSIYRLVVLPPSCHLPHQPHQNKGTNGASGSTLHQRSIVDRCWRGRWRWDPVITLQGGIIPPSIAAIMWCGRGSECFITHDKVGFWPVQTRQAKVDIVS